LKTPRPGRGTAWSLAAAQCVATALPIPSRSRAARKAPDHTPNRSAADALATKTTNNGRNNVASIILTLVAVTKANANKTIGRMIADGFLKAATICTGQAATACRQIGLSQ